MKVAVLGGDGYCGWATALYLSSRGHSVAIADNFCRRQWDHELGVQTLTPILPLSDRLRVWRDLTGETIELFVGDITEYDFLGGSEDWKLKWTKQTRPHYWLFVFSRTFKGRLLHLIKFQLVPLLKRAGLHRLRKFIQQMTTRPSVAILGAKIWRSQ